MNRAPTMNALGLPDNRLRTAVYLFAVLMASLFVFYLICYPPQSLTPQVARLRYSACQNGIHGGPLSSSLRDFDWRKAFVWRASDTEYRQRQFTQFFEMFTPRLYARLYYRFGPFMWLPMCLLCTILIGLMIALVVRQYCGDWLSGLVAGSFWLMSAEALVGYHAPVRYAKDFVTLEILGMMSLLLALRRGGRRRPAACVVGFFLLLGAGLFTDEYMLITLPAFIAAILAWPWLRRFRGRLVAGIVILVLLSLWLFVHVLPGFPTPDQRQPFIRSRLSSLPAAGLLLHASLRYLLLNTWDNLAYTFGSSVPRTPFQIVLAALAAGVLILNIAVNRAWKGAGRLVIFWAVMTVFAAGLLLPQGTDILHQQTYYNRPLIAVLLVVFGTMTSRVLESRRRWCPWSWLGALLVCAALNVTTELKGFLHDPEEAYLTRYGLNNILDLHWRLRAGELESPVFVSYPQFRDVVNGVYEELEAALPYTLENGFPWSLYRSLMPRLYLRHFEKGELRADPRQFAVWTGADEHAYRAACRIFYDMPSGTAWDLEALRQAVYFAPQDLRWTDSQGQIIEAALRRDLLGEVPFAILPKGLWETEVPVPVLVAGGPPSSLVFALRSEGPARFTVKGDGAPRQTECAYRWSWQIFAVPAFSGARLRLETDGEAEIIGPILVPSAAPEVVPLSGRKTISPSGIPPLVIRGRREERSERSRAGSPAGGERLPAPSVDYREQT